MKYFTKEWYALCLKTFLAELLEDDDRAAKKDEEFYNELLKQRLGESLAMQAEIAKMSDEDIEIDIGEYEKDYLRALDERVRDLYSVLPEDISEEIADMRVFALNKATPEIHKRLRIYCNGAQKKVDDTLKQFGRYSRRNRRQSRLPRCDNRIGGDGERRYETRFRYIPEFCNAFFRNSERRPNN